MIKNCFLSSIPFLIYNPPGAHLGDHMHGCYATSHSDGGDGEIMLLKYMLTLLLQFHNTIL